MRRQNERRSGCGRSGRPDPLRPAGPAGPTLDEFLDTVRPRLRGLLRGFGIPEQDADDLIQNTLLALVFRWDRIRNPDAWVVGAIKKNCLMYWRSRRRRLYDTVDGPVLEWLAGGERPSQERRDLRNDLGAMLHRLPRRYRTLLHLRYGLGYDSREVARRMGYRRSSIGKVTARSLAALGREMADAGFHGPDRRYHSV
ncbi:MAG: sigma-70 family RNA polymerase sigma factor [Acidobacteriota bacterium]|jgi:RNA polymerase sigma factor (sigma-70 family)